MIETIVKYTDKDKVKLEDFYKELGKEAEYIGEDGGMACRATTQHGAAIKMKRKLLEDIGEFDIEDDFEDNVGGLGFLHLVNKNNRDHEHMVREECEWFVSYKERSDYPLYVYDV